jgi:hypothetical protein
MLNHVARVFRAPDHLFDCAKCLVNSGHLAVKPSEACIAKHDDGGERLVHFMGDGGRELTHGGDAVGVRQLHLHIAEGLFGALALDELTDLAADGSQHVEQLLIGLPDLAAEKLDHAQDFPPEQDGKAEGRV